MPAIYLREGGIFPIASAFVYTVYRLLFLRRKSSYSSLPWGNDVFMGYPNMRAIA